MGHGLCHSAEADVANDLYARNSSKPFCAIEVTSGPEVSGSRSLPACGSARKFGRPHGFWSRSCLAPAKFLPAEFFVACLLLYAFFTGAQPEIHQSWLVDVSENFSPTGEALVGAGIAEGTITLTNVPSTGPPIDMGLEGRFSRIAMNVSGYEVELTITQAGQAGDGSGSPESNTTRIVATPGAPVILRFDRASPIVSVSSGTNSGSVLLSRPVIFDLASTRIQSPTVATHATIDWSRPLTRSNLLLLFACAVLVILILRLLILWRIARTLSRGL